MITWYVVEGLRQFFTSVEGNTLSFLGDSFLALGGYGDDDSLLGMFRADVRISTNGTVVARSHDWADVPSPPELFLEGHTAVVDSLSKTVLVFGGMNGDYEKSGALHTIGYGGVGGVWDVTCNVACIGRSPAPRSRHAACTTSTHMYIFGGD